MLHDAPWCIRHKNNKFYVDLQDRPFIIKAQYGPATLVSLINLLVCAWPTENMLRVVSIFVFK